MGYVNPDTVHRPSTGTTAPAAWGDTVADDLNYIMSSGGVTWAGSSSFAYATGGSVVNYGHTFTATPFPVISLGDDTGPTSVVIIGSAGTTSSFKVKCYTGSTETANGTAVRVNWMLIGNV